MNPKPKKKTRIPAELGEIEFDFLEQCVRLGAVEWRGFPDKPPELPPSALARLRRLQRICRSLELDVFAGSIIVDLLERMEEMQRDLERLHLAMDVRPK